MPMRESLFIALVDRDLRLAARRRVDALLPLAFFAIGVSLFPLGLGPEPQTLRQIGPGVIWVCALLAAMLSLNALFAGDQADGSLEQMLLSGHSGVLIVAAKATAHWVLTGLPLVVVSPLFGLFFDVRPSSLPMLAFSLLLGTPVALHLGSLSSAPPKKPTTERMTVVIEMLKTQPDDAVAWALLGRTYAAQGKHEQAVQALRNAIALKPDDGLVMAEVAVALAAVDQRNLQGESRQLAERALALDPHNAKALSLLATAALDRRDYALAIKQWETVVLTQPAGSPVAVQALTALGEARRRAGQ